MLKSQPKTEITLAHNIGASLVWFAGIDPLSPPNDGPGWGTGRMLGPAATIYLDFVHKLGDSIKVTCSYNTRVEHTPSLIDIALRYTHAGNSEIFATLSPYDGFGGGDIEITGPMTFGEMYPITFSIDSDEPADIGTPWPTLTNIDFSWTHNRFAGSGGYTTLYADITNALTYG